MTRPTTPLDPMARQLAQLAASGLSRRRLLSMSAGGAALAALAACAPPTPPASGAAVLELPVDMSETDKRVNFANWVAYLDYDEETSTYPTLEAFMKESSITVKYTEEIDDNDSFFSKVAPQLRNRQDINRDIFVFTDWMANRIIRDQLVQPLELIRMANVHNLLPSLKDVSFDPGRQHSLPWQGGFGGIGYNRDAIGRDLKTIDDLWADDLKGKVVVLNEFRDTAGMIMQSQGTKISGPFDKTAVENAFAEVTKRIDDGSIRRVKGNSYIEDLKSGNAVAGIVWSGDLFVLRAETENESWQFQIPESGGTIWTDNMMIPITSTRRRNAQKVMDHYYDPAIAAQVAAWVNYVCPVVGAQEEMEKIDPELAQSDFIFPTEAFLKENLVESFRALDPQEDADYSAMWAKVVGN